MAVIARANSPGAFVKPGRGGAISRAGLQDRGGIASPCCSVLETACTSRAPLHLLGNFCPCACVFGLSVFVSFAFFYFFPFLFCGQWRLVAAVTHLLVCVCFVFFSLLVSWLLRVRGSTNVQLGRWCSRRNIAKFWFNYASLHVG